MIIWQDVMLYGWDKCFIFLDYLSLAFSKTGDSCMTPLLNIKKAGRLNKKRMKKEMKQVLFIFAKIICDPARVLRLMLQISPTEQTINSGLIIFVTTWLLH